MSDRISVAPPSDSSRRKLLKWGEVVAAVGVAHLAIVAPASPSVKEGYADDLAILNVALGLEHQAIAAYQAGAESKLLPAPVLEIAVSFQSDHKHHRDALIGLIRKYGGTPVEAKSSYDFGTIKSAGDILNLALTLEQGAVDAYLANAYKLKSGDILNSAVPIVLDEVRHATVFRLALGLPVTERPKY
jgi:rubrerythrin